MNVLDIFSGIGGFSLGLERAGLNTIAFAECEPYCRRVLRRHWPSIPIYEDVADITRARLDQDGIGSVDIIAGGFPCQDIASVGKQAGLAAPRSGLWSHCPRLLGETGSIGIFENVAALLAGASGRWFEQILWDLSAIGYDAEWHCIRASAVGCNHSRDRVWLIAYPHSLGLQRRTQIIDGEQAPRTLITRGQIGRALSRDQADRDRSEPEPPVSGTDDDVPHRMDRIKAIGNSVVPYIPELIGREIKRFHDATQAV